MESKINKEEESNIKENYLYERETDNSETKLKTINSNKNSKSPKSINYCSRKLHEILNEKNFFLALDENGNTNLLPDNVYIIPNDSNLIVKILNGSKISKNCCIVLSIYINHISNPINQKLENDFDKNDENRDVSINEEEKKKKILKSIDLNNQIENKNIEINNYYFKTPKSNHIKEINSSYSINYEDLISNKYLSIDELKKISKIYNLEKKSFNSDESRIENENKKIKIHEVIEEEKIKEFEKHLIFPIVYDTDIYFIIPCKFPCPLSFFILYENSNLNGTGDIFVSIENNNNSESSFNNEIDNTQFFRNFNHHTNEINILIEPKLKIGNKEIDIEALSIQTILSKSLGKISEWEEYFKEASLLNYNIIHYTPIQMIGKSDSLYCLKDQTEINDCFFIEKTPKEEKFTIIKNKITNLKKNYNIGSIVDIVLNHTAANSEWLLNHPDAGYNLDNCPYLTVSYELDKIILDYSHRFSGKKVSCKSSPFIYNENDLSDLMGELSSEIYKKNFDEYFLISIENIIDEFIFYYISYKKNFNDYLKKKKYLANKLIEKKLNFYDENHIYQLILESADNYGASRYGVKINTEFISILLLKDGFSENQFICEVKKYLNRLNEDWRNKSKEFIKQAVENTKAGIRYEFIQLKRYKVTEKKRLVENYFTSLEANNKKAIFACNGWLFGVNDPTINFAKYGFWNYFNRSIVIWGDCVKLNYGEKSEDSPYLWKHMTEYVIGMAQIFDGFRLDNAHSTPIYLAEFLIKKAREVNPNLIIIAELFAGTKEREIEFVKRIGINLLIREIIYCSNTEEICDNLFKFGGGKERVLGKLDENSSLYLDSNKILKYKKLKGRKPKSVIFDITHDNPTLFEKYSNLGLNLTYLCCNSMIGSSIGSTRGFDQLFPYQPSVVKENRVYSYDYSFENIIKTNQKILGDQEEFIKTYSNCLNYIKNEEFINNEFITKFEKDIENTKTKLEEKIIIDKSTTFEFNPSQSGIYYIPHKVCLAISSNGWKPDIVLEKINNNLWRKKLPLPDGIYEYKYVINNNNWVFDKSKPTIKDKSNNVNNQLLIGQNISSNIKTNYNQTQNDNIKIINHEFYLSNKDLKILRREMNFLRRIIAETTNYDLSEFFIWRDRDILLIYRGLYNDLTKKDNENNIDYDGYALISRSGFEKNVDSLVSSRIELPGIIYELVFFANIKIPEFDLDKIRCDQKIIGVDSNIFFSKNIKNLWEISKINRV